MKDRKFEPQRTIFLDSNIWTAWLDLDSTRSNQDPAMRAKNAKIKGIMDDQVSPWVQAGDIGILYSGAITADVYGGIDLDKFKKAISILVSSGFVSEMSAELDLEMVGELRHRISDYMKLNGQHIKGKPSLGDSIVCYMAMLYNCDELWTNDPALLFLSEKQVVRNLKIVEPNLGGLQGTLPF